MVNPILGGSYDLVQRLNQIEARQRAFATQPILLNASTGQDGGNGLSTDKDGLHLFNAAGVESATLRTADGSATFSGPVTILGTLSLPNGSINNAALLNPFQPGSAGISQTNYATTTSDVTYAQQTITVPAGFTQCMVMNGVSAGGWNNTASADYIYVSASINGLSGGQTAQYAAPSSFGSASAFAIRTLTGLTGGSTFTVGTAVHTGSSGWAANGANFANTNAVALFLR